MWVNASYIVLLLFSSHWSIYSGTNWWQSEAWAGSELSWMLNLVKTSLTVQKHKYTVLYLLLIKPKSSDQAFWLSFVEFEIKLLGEFCLKILMLSHCWVHLVKYIVVVTLMGKFWFQLLLWSHCWSKFALKEIVMLLLGHL